MRINMHFTIDREGTGHWLPPHDVGADRTRQLVQLGEGDSADNPSSSQRPFHGPAFVVYDNDGSGVTARVFDGPAGFYADLERRTHAQAEHESLAAVLAYGSNV
jgi:hypothetical protein